MQNEQPINAGNDITEYKTGQHEEHNDNTEDMQVEQQSSNEDKNMEETQEDRKDNKVNDDKQDDIDEQMDTDNVQKDSDKPKRWIYHHIAPMQAKWPTNFFRMLEARLKALGNSSISNVLKGQRQLSVLCVVSRIKPYKNWNYMYGENINHTATNVHTAGKST